MLRSKTSFRKETFTLRHKKAHRRQSSITNMPFLFATNCFDPYQVFLNSGRKGGKTERKKEAFRKEVKIQKTGAVTLVRVGAVHFSEQRSYDHWKIRLHLVYSKIQCYSSEKLKDARSLKV